MFTRAKRLTISTGLVLATAFGGLLLSATPASAAGDKVACIPIRLNSGVLCALVDNTSIQSINSFGGNFTSATPISRPRLYVEMQSDVGPPMTVEQSWGNDRTAETVRKVLNQSFATPFQRVCATLFEAGAMVDTVCFPIPTNGS